MVWWKPAGRAGCVVAQPMRSCVPYSESSWRSVTSLAVVYAAVVAFCMQATHMTAAFVNVVYNRTSWQMSVGWTVLASQQVLMSGQRFVLNWLLCWLPSVRGIGMPANKFMSMTKQRLQLACLHTNTCIDLQSYATAAKGLQILCRSTGLADSTRSTRPSLPP